MATDSQPTPRRCTSLGWAIGFLLAAMASAVVWVGTLAVARDPSPAPPPIVPLAALAAFSVFIGLWLRCGWRGRWIVPACVALFVGSIYLHSCVERQIEVKHGPIGEGLVIDCRTYFTPFSHHAVYSSSRFADQAGKTLSLVEGPLLPNGEPHGEWVDSDFNGSGASVKHKWYWYGEEVSEGDFHRNNGGR
ncbi:MAG TPA: hypothetical protein VHY20_04855 [Pirellulales bacterium]|nr:hypothetical protein [Pirellulales bacterium]